MGDLAGMFGFQRQPLRTPAQVADELLAGMRANKRRDLDKILVPLCGPYGRTEHERA